MSIIYSLVGKEDRIFAEHTNFSGNFVLTASKVLKACDNRKFMKYAANNYIFYVLSAQCVYLVMCDRAYSERIAFNFLQKVRSLFTNLFDQQKIAKAKMYEMIQFGAIIKTQMQLYNQPEQVDKVARLMKQTQQVSKIIEEDLQKILARGQKIEILVRKTETMQVLSLQMKSSAGQVRNQMAWQNWKMKIIIILVIIAVIYFILVLSCGGFTLSGCF